MMKMKFDLRFSSSKEAAVEKAMKGKLATLISDSYQKIQKSHKATIK